MLDNAVNKFIRFKSIEVLLRLEAKNNKLFVTIPDDISGLVVMRNKNGGYLKGKFEIESKMCC